MDVLLWIVFVLSMVFVCSMGSRQEMRIDALENQIKLMRQESERAKHQAWDDGR